jgi:hypothetical protein
MLPPAMDLLDELLERLIVKSAHNLVLGRAALDTALGHFFSYSCAIMRLVITILSYFLFSAASLSCVL